MLNRKKDDFSKFDNTLSSLNGNKLEYLQKIHKIDEQINNTTVEKINYGLQYFIKREKRLELLEQAEKYGYSQLKINELSQFIDNWNQDIVTNDIIDSFRLIEQFINNNQEPYKNNIMYKFSKLFNDIGGNENEN